MSDSTRFTTTLGRDASRPSPSRSARRQRGSVIIFAVGVLVLLAVLAAVFLTSSQQQRETGTSTVIQHTTQRTGVGAHKYVEHIADIIARDVFDPMTPEAYLDRPADPDLLVSTASSAFELWDYPHTRRGPNGEITVGSPDLFNKGGDDPWLAEIDPRTPPGGNDRLGLIEPPHSFDETFGYWMNLSKIHPLGTFVRIGYDDEVDNWVDDPTKYGIIDATTNPELGDPTQPDGQHPFAPNGIFSADNATPPPSPEQDLDRVFADADGDGHYDSRWLRWEEWHDADRDGDIDPANDIYLGTAMGDLPGTTTYIAARVVDLSAMINVNTALNYSTGTGPDFPPLAAGDVDLKRFLAMPDYATTGFEDYAAVDILQEALFGFEDLALDFGYDRLDSPENSALYLPGTQTVERRNRLWTYDIYQARTDGVGELFNNYRTVPRFGAEDELELRSYAARNDPANRSRLEQVLDVQGSNNFAGPLRSDTADEIATRGESVPQYMVDLRHRLTTMSKARRLGSQTGRYPTRTDPNTGETLPAYPMINTKAPLPTPFDTNVDPDSVDYEHLLTRYFKAFSHALAPYATLDTPESFATWNTFPDDDYLAYGWDMLPRTGVNAVEESTEAFAVRTAAHLALNTMSLTDAGGSIFNGPDEPPAMVRLVYKPEAAEYTHFQTPGGEVINDGVQLSLADLGVLDPANDPTNYFTTQYQYEPEVWLFAQKPQPFLVEAASFVIYQDLPGLFPADPSDPDPAGNPPPPTLYRIEPPTEPGHKALYIELRNPYDDVDLRLYDPAWVEPRYELRLSDDETRAIPIKEIGSQPIDLLDRGSGQDIVVLEVLNTALAGDLGMRDELRQALGLVDEGGEVISGLYTIEAPVGEFWEHSHDRVELWRRLALSTDADAEVEFALIDVMETTSTNEFPNDPTISDAYVDADEDVIAFEAYIQRNTDDALGGGMPAFVIETTDVTPGAEEKWADVFSREGHPSPTSSLDQYFNDSTVGLTFRDHGEFGERDKDLAKPFTDLEPIQLFTLLGSSLDIEQEQLLRVGDIGLVPAVGPEAFSPIGSPSGWYLEADNWVTVSQQLARKVLDEDGVEQPLYELPGPETLQFQRSIVDGFYETTDNAERPWQLMPALPVALRVFDAVDYAFGTSRSQRVGVGDYTTDPALMDALSGQININTAPYEVLRMLPFVQDEAMQPGHDLATTIINYRDQRGVLSPIAQGLGFFADELLGPWRDEVHGIDFARDAPGFTSIGELLMLVDELNPNVAGAIDYLASGGNEIYPFYDLTDDDASDDAEEERLIFSGLSNMVTVRSDMFCVYLKIKAYREGDAIDLPSVEQRWVAVIDRSNVVVPGDKARIVFMQRVE